MRARNIKPGFYFNENLAECSFAARLLFPGLWMLADRSGRLEYRPKRWKAELFPYDNVDPAELFSELERFGLVSRYKAGVVELVWIPKFGAHQNPHCKEKASEFPPHPDENPVLEQEEDRQEQRENDARTVQEQDEHQCRPADSGFLIPDSGFLIPDPGFRIQEEVCAEPETDSTPSTQPHDESPVFLSIPLVGKKAGEFPVTEAMIAEWEVAFPAVDVRQSLRKIRQWNLANPKKRKTARGIAAHIVSWLSVEQDKGGTRASPQRQFQPANKAQALQDANIAVGQEWLKSHGVTQ